MQLVLSKSYGDGFFTRLPQSKTTDADLVSAVLKQDQHAFDTAFWMLDLWHEYGHQQVSDFYVSEIGDDLVHIECYMGNEYVVPVGGPEL